jgi:hypothetical protein
MAHFYFISFAQSSPLFTYNKYMGQIERAIFARGISLGQKWRQNSFGKRFFMQPIMGRPKHALKVPCFFAL